MATREMVCRHHRIRMFVLIWGILLSGASVWGKRHCQLGNFCITLSEAVITAEAGLCVVIPCSFTTNDNFKTQHIVWYYKCESSTKCVDANMIFHTNKLDNKVQSLFKGRVSLLQPDVSQGNCSIMFNHFTESDSGGYQLRVVERDTNGFTFSRKTTVTVKGLTQKPSVMIPPLTEGQQTTLTCTAPGLCSGSDPRFTWTWRGAGEKDSLITGNITALKTEDLTAVTQRHSSTLTFNSSAEHHNSNVTCKVSFRNNIIAEETVTLKVNFLPRILSTSGCVVQSEVLTCVCISEGFPLPTIKWPLLDTEYSVTTNFSNHAVHISITVTLKDHNYTTVECISSNDIGEVKENLIVTRKVLKQYADQHGPCGVLLWLGVAAVSLIVNVICIILLMFLWHSRKKVKPNQEDRTYMSIKKTEVSSDYDVIAQPLN